MPAVTHVVERVVHAYVDGDLHPDMLPKHCYYRVKWKVPPAKIGDRYNTEPHSNLVKFRGGKAAIAAFWQDSGAASHKLTVFHQPTRARSFTKDERAARRRSVRGAKVAPGCFRVRKSGVHGQGIFALRTWAPGDAIAEVVGAMVPKQYTTNAHSGYQVDCGSAPYYIDQCVKAISSATRYMNHSPSPNAHLDEHNGRVFLYASTHILKREEILIDYGKGYLQVLLPHLVRG